MPHNRRGRSSTDTRKTPAFPHRDPSSVVLVCVLCQFRLYLRAPLRKSHGTNPTRLRREFRHSCVCNQPRGPTADTDPINSRASGAAQLACFGLHLRNGPASVGSANKHGGVPGRSRRCWDHCDRPFALVQLGTHAASSEAGARRHRRYSHVSTDLSSAAKGPGFLM